MMMSGIVTVVRMRVAAVSTTFGLEGRLQLYKVRSEGPEHILDHMVRPNAKNLVSNLGRRVPISQMPGKANELIGIFVSDLHNELRRGLNLQPSSIRELQAVPIGHRNRFRKVEKDIFALIRRHANAAAVTRVEVESESACRLLLRPVPGGTVN
jgi:hypothetical protein